MALMCLKKKGSCFFSLIIDRMYSTVYSSFSNEIMNRYYEDFDNKDLRPFKGHSFRPHYESGDLAQIFDNYETDNCHLKTVQVFATARPRNILV